MVNFSMIEVVNFSVDKHNPLWEAFVSIGDMRDPLSKFIALWGLLDIGVNAERVEQIDDYLVLSFEVPREYPDRRGVAGETKFANLRHSIAHPSGRGVASVPDLKETASRLVPELTEMCRVAVMQRFAIPTN